MYNFDEIISRGNTNSISYEAWKMAFPDLKDKDTSDYTRLWVADMDFASPPEVIEGIRKRLDDRILGYSLIFDPGYFRTLENWFEKRYNWKINTEEIVISPGVVPALLRLVPFLTKDDEGILFTTPSYAPFKLTGDYSKRQVFTSDLVQRNGRFEMDFEDIRHQIKDENRKIKVFILCNPHNPTGRVWSPEELKELGEICLANEVWIISDEIHCDLLRVGLKHTALQTLFPDTDRIITCTSPSKTFNLAGNMLSHIFIPNNEIRRKWTSQFHEVLSPLSISASQSAYSFCEDWLEELKIYLDKNFQFLEEFLKKNLPEANYIKSEGTYLAWVNFSYYLNQIPENKKIIEFFVRNAKVVIEDETKFISNSKGFVRINVACPQSVLRKGLVNISECFSELGKFK